MNHRVPLFFLIVAFSFVSFGCSGKSAPQKFLKLVGEDVYVADSFPKFRQIEGDEDLHLFLRDLQDSNGSLVLGGLGILQRDSESVSWVYQALAAYEIETLMDSKFNDEDWN